MKVTKSSILGAIVIMVIILTLLQVGGIEIEGTLVGEIGKWIILAFCGWTILEYLYRLFKGWIK